LSPLSYSWHGKWYALSTSVPSISEFAIPIVENLASFWANPQGSPGGAGSAGRPWAFVLVFQNDWSFIPDYPDLVPMSSPLRTNITAEAEIVKAAALQEVRDAFSGVGVVVAEGTANTGDDRATIVNSQTLVPNSPSCGGTNINALSGYNRTHDSQVSYVQIMEEAQQALKIPITNAQEEANALTNPSLLHAIGRGIGDTASHEIAHHFLLGCCTMDSNPLAPGDANPDPNVPDPDARGTINATGCSGKTDPSPWTGYWPSPVIPLHWEAPASKALGCLGGEWKDFYGACHN